MNASAPLISVIMPCYNAAGIIEQTVAHLFQQTIQNFELIIVDDGSTDNSAFVLKKLSDVYPNVTILEQQNKGPGPARNRGIKAASGQFIAFLDSDDSWEPTCLAKLHNALLNSPGSILAYCGWQNTGLDSNHTKPYIPPDYEQNDKLALLLYSCPWPIHAALTYKTAIDKVEGFNEKWLTAEDYDMWLRIASFEKIVRVPEVLAFYHHHHGDQISKNKLRTILNHWGVQKAFIRDFPIAIDKLGKTKIKEITDGKLLCSAYECYWNNDLYASYTLFRKLITLGYFGFSDIKYLISALLPYPVYKFIVNWSRS